MTRCTSLLTRSSLLILLAGGAPQGVRGQEGWAGHRLAIGPGTILLVPDTSAGLILWASRPARPGQRRSPDFVAWLAPERVGLWAVAAREVLDGPAPEPGIALESPALESEDRGSVAVLRTNPDAGGEAALVFGHASERQRWFLEGSLAEVAALLDSMKALAPSSRLQPPAGTGYANPTNRRSTPDRIRAPLPALSGTPGEIWARAALDPQGTVVAGSAEVLWATRAALGRAVLAVLPAYRYRRKDGGRPERLWIYQRFRVRAGRP